MTTEREVAAIVNPPQTIAIDGPAASGKSTLGRDLAEALGYLFFDTGVMYRAVTLAALQQGVPVDDEERVSELAEAAEIDVRPAEDSHSQSQVTLNGQAVTGQLRSAQVDRHVSQVSAYPRVRRAMTDRQREIGGRGRVVMVGRDIGTVVLPEADLKIFLEASVEVRARRRQLENEQKGEPTDYQAILRSMKARDKFDANRELAPLRPAADAIHLDTTHLTREEALEAALALVKEQGDKKLS